jgi:ABC-type phosphate transport system substrate-binding protein
MRRLTAVAGTLGIAAALVGGMSTAAFADPPSGVTPASTDIVSVGADTSQFVMNAIASAWNGSALGTTTKVYSWDALAPAGVTDNCGGSVGDIKTKTGAPCILRPNGSGPGESALLADIASNTTVDYARTSVGRSSSDPATISFVAMAGDAVTIAQTGTVAAPAAPGAYTLNDLKFIYSCLGTGPLGAPKFNELPDAVSSSTEVIKPYLPPNGSGTRKFFLTAINGGTTPLTPGACVTSGPEQNEGDNAALHQKDVVFPYSVAVALGEVLHPANYPGNTVGVLQFPKVGTTVANAVLPYAKVGGSYEINLNLPSLVERLIYNIVRTSSTADHIPTKLEPLLGSAANGGAICKYGSNLISSFGFLPLPASLCGQVS